MKKTLLIAAFAIISASSVCAQGQAVQGEQAERPTLETFVTNKWYDNIFIGVSGGVATQFGKEIEENFIGPTAKLSVIKWFSPVMGFRIEAQNTWAKEGLNGYNPYHMGTGHSALPYKITETGKYGVGYAPGTLKYGNLFASASLLWNLTQFFGYYNPERFWNISAYIQGGYSHLYDNNEGITSKNYDREYSLGAGLFNTFRITERLHASLDLDFAGYSANYRTTNGVLTMSPSVTVGLAYNIYKTNWDGTRFDPYAFIAPVDNRDYDALARQLAERDKSLSDLQKQLGNTQDDLNKTDAELNALKSQVEKQYKAFFELDKSSITFAERQHIRQFVQSSLKKNADQKFRLTGSADKGTGTYDHNIVLAADRAESVKKFMVEELGVKAENISLAEPLVTDSQMDASFDRSVLIECL
ncbi:MAG: OmpA family protein [Bacteroidaceae bacterium]|nr:OmpA family protein [Bacteroidaceae bacterium]